MAEISKIMPLQSVLPILKIVSLKEMLRFKAAFYETLRLARC